MRLADEDVEVIVVDNGSALGVDMMKSLSDVYIRNEKNLGFTRGNNQGIEVAKGKYIVLANNDYYVEEGWDTILRSILDNNEYVGSIAPATLGSDDNFQKKLWHCGLPGQFFMVRKETFDKIGLLDEQFLNAMSDVDFVLRILDLGQKCFKTSLTKGWHRVSATASKVEKDGREWEESKRLFIRKWENNKTHKPYIEKLTPNGNSYRVNLGDGMEGRIKL